MHDRHRERVVGVVIRRIGLLIGSLVLVATLASPAQAVEITDREGTQTFSRDCIQFGPNHYCRYTPNYPTSGDLQVKAYHAKSQLNYRVTRPHSTLSQLQDLDIIVSNVNNCEAAGFVGGYEVKANYVDVDVTIGNASGPETRCTIVRVKATWNDVF